MEEQVEKEICANCKKEIPHFNYVMHTVHCARNIALCKICKEPFPKAQISEHTQKCEAALPKQKPKPPPPTKIEESAYFQERKSIEDKKIAARRERYFQKMDGLFPPGDKSGHGDDSPKEVGGTKPKLPKEKVSQNGDVTGNKNKQNSSLLACKYCDLELPKLDLEEHENYCGSRTDKCLECGEIVMFKYKELHQETNHGFLKLKDEPGPKPTWESTTSRSEAVPEPQTRRNRPPRFQPFYNMEDYIPPSYAMNAGTPQSNTNKEKLESSKEISRRLDCKTEYIRNLLHESASVTAPLRSTGAVPRSHNKAHRRRNPPTELVIPCEFCNVPIPHEDLIQHETGCRPDLAKYNPRRRSPTMDDYFTAPEPSSPEPDLPCEFCAEIFPASELMKHQLTCT